MTSEEMKQIDKLIAVGAVVEVNLQNTAKLVYLLEAMRDENVRLRESLELADAYLNFANMNMKAVEKKVKQALKGGE